MTGSVPYEPGGRTLAEMMHTFLLSTGVEEQNIIIGGGVGIASEARDLMTKLAGSEAEADVVLVSSNWYFWPGQIMWRRWAKKTGAKKPKLVKVYKTGGLITRIKYFVYFLIVLGGILFRRSDWVEQRLTQWQSKRLTEGFKMNGCA